MSKQAFKTAALGVPNLSQGNWIIQDVAGHGMLPGIGAAITTNNNTLDTPQPSPGAWP